MAGTRTGSGFFLSDLRIGDFADLQRFIPVHPFRGHCLTMP